MALISDPSPRPKHSPLAIPPASAKPQGPRLTGPSAGIPAPPCSGLKRAGVGRWGAVQRNSCPLGRPGRERQQCYLGERACFRVNLSACHLTIGRTAVRGKCNVMSKAQNSGAQITTEPQGSGMASPGEMDPGRVWFALVAGECIRQKEQLEQEREARGSG